jgi:hypothetical protein
MQVLIQGQAAVELAELEQMVVVAAQAMVAVEEIVILLEVQ